MKVIVFGGSGFLGSHVADALTASGYHVVIFDKQPSPYLHPEQRMVVGDILDIAQVAEAMKGCDYVYNFAGIADLDDATTKPLETVMLNILGNINIMDCALREKVKRFFYASSIYVYSQKGGFYRCSKQASEVYIEEYQRRFGLNFTVLRYGTLYGPRADTRNSVFNYLKQAIEKRKIICSGSGESTREYIHVRDAARLSALALDEKYCNQHIIISGHHTMKFRDLISMLGEIIGSNIEIEFTEQKNPDHYDYVPYSYSPKIGYKLVDTMYLDMGQGLLECLNDIYHLKA